MAEKKYNRYDDIRRDFERLIRLLTKYDQTKPKEKRLKLAHEIVYNFDFFVALNFRRVGEYIYYSKLDPYEDDVSIKYIREHYSYLLRSGFPLGSKLAGLLAEALDALNVGEVQPLLVEDARQGRPRRAFTLNKLRILAVVHVHILSGWGLKKSEARISVAKAYGIGENDSYETVRKWESSVFNKTYSTEIANELRKEANIFGKALRGKQISGKILVETPKKELLEFAEKYKGESKEAVEQNVEEILKLEGDYEYQDAWQYQLTRLMIENDHSSFDKHIFWIFERMHYSLRYLPVEVCGLLYQQALNGQHVNLPQNSIFW